MALAPTNRARFQATLAALGGFVLCWRTGAGWTAVVAGIAGALALLAWASPSYYAPIQRGFDRALHALLAGLTWALLLVVFVGVIIPLRAWQVLTRRDPLGLRRVAGTTTYLRPLRPREPRHFERQF